jgi:CO/xanthine dehydrogenase Mo-binding subunit
VGSTQSPFAQRNLIAKALGISQSDVRVIGHYVGGGFGSKAGVTMEALTVGIALKVKGHPVKLRLTREEEFITTFVRQGLVMHLKMGCDKDGKLLAMEHRYYWDGGAYTEYGVNVTRRRYSGTGPYEVPNIKIDSLRCTNHPVSGPMPGFATQRSTPASSSASMSWYESGMDPVQCAASTWSGKAASRSQGCK